MAIIKEITDFEAEELDIYARCSEVQLLNRHEPEKGIFIAESPKVIERALAAGCIPISFLAEDKQMRTVDWQIIESCEDVPAYIASGEVLKQLTGFPMTRGMLCAMYRPKRPSVKEVCHDAKRIAVLEDVVNPTNVGAIFRSAAALHMDAVLLTPGCSNPLYRRAIRVSMGTVFQIPWTFIGNTKEGAAGAMEELKELGFQTAAMALTDKTISIADERLQKIEKLAVILGTEGDGLSKSTIESSDYAVKIPMSHGVDSLNVAAASAVAFWQLGNNFHNL